MAKPPHCVLALDVGNTDIVGGLFRNDTLVLSFRKSTRYDLSTDELGLFLLTFFREHQIAIDEITEVAVASVVPALMHTLRAASTKYLKRIPFILTSESDVGLTISYKNPLEVGADRLANAVAVTTLYPERNVIVVDFGTAITFDVVSSRKKYLGGLILPGPRLSIEALVQKTAKLPAVELLAPAQLVGRSTIESIQSGIFFGTLHMVRSLLKEVALEAFGSEQTLFVGTGGFSRLFSEYGLFEVLEPDLVLKGILYALNHQSRPGTVVEATPLQK